MKINTTNYEEYFLLYFDNELSAEQRTAVELFIEENPVYKKEFSLLQQSVLAPENIEFEDKILLYRLEEMEASLPNTFKQSLYRKEAKLIDGFFNTKLNRSIAAVAAVVLFIVGYNLIPTIPGKQSNHAELANNKPVIKNDAPSYVINKTKQSSNELYQGNGSGGVRVSGNGIGNKRLNTILPMVAEKKNKYAQEASIIQSLATTAGHIINNENETRTAPIANNTVAISSVNQKIASNEASAVAEAKEAFENIDTDNPDRTIYIANMEIDGDKLRGFTRRIGAFIKRNKTEKEK
jgi:hypothetical protein